MKNMDIINALREIYPNAEMVRVGHANYLAIPTDEVSNDRPVFKKVFVGNFSVKDTENAPAFDYDTAKQEYTEWEAAAAERAARPKAESRNDSSERQAVRMGIVSGYVSSNKFEHKTATDIYNAVKDKGFDGIIPACGKILKELVSSGVLEMTTEKGKNYYSTL